MVKVPFPFPEEITCQDIRDKLQVLCLTEEKTWDFHVVLLGPYAIHEPVALGRQCFVYLFYFNPKRLFSLGCGWCVSRGPENVKGLGGSRTFIFVM